MIFLPRPHFSYTQLITFENSPELYEKLYILGEDGYESPQMVFGKEVADALKSGKAQNNATKHLLEHFAIYPQKEYMLTTTLKIGRNKVVLLGYLDGYDPKKLKLGENKTGRLWTQDRVDKSDQITFYNLMLYKEKGKMFKENALHWAETKFENGEVLLTGKIETFYTKRTKIDLLKLESRIIKAVKSISKMMERHLNKIK
jgi:hypothetical protein